MQAREARERSGARGGAAPAKKSPGTSPENFQSQSRRANAEKLRILQRKRWRLYFWSSEQNQYQASCPSDVWGGTADTTEYQCG